MRVYTVYISVHEIVQGKVQVVILSEKSQRKTGFGYSTVPGTYVP